MLSWQLQYDDGEEEEGAEEGEYDEDADPDYNPGVSNATVLSPDTGC